MCVQWKTPDDGQRNCPKHVEFYSRIKFEKLVHLVGFIIIIIIIIAAAQLLLVVTIVAINRTLCPLLAITGTQTHDSKRK